MPKRLMWILPRRTSTAVSSPFSSTRKLVLAGLGGLSAPVQVACTRVGSSMVSSQRIFLFIPPILVLFPCDSMIRRKPFLTLAMRSAHVCHGVATPRQATSSHGTRAHFFYSADANFENWAASLKRFSNDSDDAFSANTWSLASVAHTIQPSCCAPETYRSPSAARLSV